MALRRYLAIASAIAQVETLTMASVASTNTFTVTITDLQDGTTAAVTYTAGSATLATELTGMVAKLEASNHPLFTALNWDEDGIVITATAKNAGRPFSLATTRTGGTSTFTRATTIASSGASDAKIAANWSGNAVPVDGDDIWLDGASAAKILYNLDFSAVTPRNYTHYRSFPGFGTDVAALRFAGFTGTVEHGIPVEDGGAVINIGGFCNLHVGTSAVTINVYSTALDGEGGLAPFVIGANNTANILNIYAGTVDVSAGTPNEVGNFASIVVRGGNVYLAPGVICPSVTNNGGSVLQIDMTTKAGALIQMKGTTTLSGTQRIASINFTGGTVNVKNRTALKAATITQTTGTATLTSTAHGYSNGDVVYITGANQAAYNGYHTVSNVAANTFDFAVDSGTVSPATGTIKVKLEDVGELIMDSPDVNQKVDVSVNSANIRLDTFTQKRGGTVLVSAYDQMSVKTYTTPDLSLGSDLVVKLAA